MVPDPCWAAGQVQGPIRVYLTWNAPYGDPNALTDLAVSVADTNKTATLFLTFDVPPGRAFTPHNIGAVLLFEPLSPDSLGTFWGFERGAANNGNLRIDFDTMIQEACQDPFPDLVNGHVGYTRAGSRGRLDLTAEARPGKTRAMLPDVRYCFARVLINQRLARRLTGLARPVRITWAGARFLTAHQEIGVLSGPGRTVTWNGRRAVNAPRIAWRSPRVWIPQVAPQSRLAIAGRAIESEAAADTSTNDR